MSFIIDASVAGTWLFPDEQHPDADAALELLKDNEAYVPVLFWVEIRNLLITGERRQRITSSETTKALEGLQSLPLQIDMQADSDRTLQLARNHQLTVYDATYLELAVRRSFSLFTFDSQLAAAARSIGIQVN